MIYVVYNLLSIYVGPTPIMVVADFIVDEFVIAVFWQVCGYMLFVLYYMYVCVSANILKHMCMYMCIGSYNQLYSKHYHVQYHCNGSV